MILLLDCGNTLIKFAWYQNNSRGPASALPYGSLTNLADHIKQQPTAIFGTNVASNEIKSNLESVSKNNWNLPIKWCDYKQGRSLLHSNYTETLGADRWLAALGLWQQIKQDNEWLNGQPYLLASFGTATTIDTIWLDPKINSATQARYMGGLILPGLELMRTSLAQGTAALPWASAKPDSFPLDTHTAIYSGIIAAQSGAILRQWQNAKHMAANLAPKVYVCGGAWPTISSDIQAELSLRLQAKFICTKLENPVLDGLALIAAEH